MILKMNSLEDASIIEKLYDASRAGVPIQIIVPGNMPTRARESRVRARPSKSGASWTDNLEHARMYVFHNNGEEKMFSRLRRLDDPQPLEDGSRWPFPCTTRRFGVSFASSWSCNWPTTVKARVDRRNAGQPVRPACRRSRCGRRSRSGTSLGSL